MFGTFNNPDPRSFSAFNPAMQQPWHMHQNYYTPQPLPSYYPPAPGMNYHNTFHGSPFDYQPTPYGGQPHPMYGPPMMDPYYDSIYKESSMFDSCCPPRNPYDHMVPPYEPQHSMRQSKPDPYQESVNNPSQSQSQTQQNPSSTQSRTRQQQRY